MAAMVSPADSNQHCPSGCSDCAVALDARLTAGDLWQAKPGKGNLQRAYSSAIQSGPLQRIAGLERGAALGFGKTDYAALPARFAAGGGDRGLRRSSRAGIAQCGDGFAGSSGALARKAK